MNKKINPNLRKLAELTHNPSLKLPDLSKQEEQTPIQISFPENVDESFIFSYDGPHGNFAQELIAKNNEMFKGTRAEIPVGDSGGVEKMYILKRMGLVTAIAKDSNLRTYGMFPITPLQSEMLLKQGKLPKPTSYWEDLGLILYDKSSKGVNSKEAQALHESLRSHKNELGLTNDTLDSRLVIVNAGLEKDSNMPYGVKPIVIPGITQVYTHDILQKTGKNYNFEYGLNNGLPNVNELGKGERTLYMPSNNKNLGLRVLCRYRDLDLDARFEDLAYSGSGGRVNFAPQGRTPR